MPRRHRARRMPIWRLGGADSCCRGVCLPRDMARGPLYMARNIRYINLNGGKHCKSAALNCLHRVWRENVADNLHRVWRARALLLFICREAAVAAIRLLVYGIKICALAIKWHHVAGAYAS